MKALFERLFHFGPLIFAFGFLVPLIAQVYARLGWAPPFSLSPMVFALIIGGILGLAAQVRGRWV